MSGLPNVHPIDTVTKNTFISGRITEKGETRGKEGLLERIGDNAIMVFPDFSTVLEGDRHQRNEIFAQLRRIYDGELRREFGAELPNTSWAGRLTIGAAVTPAVDKYSSVFSSLGDRFVLIRWPRVGDVDAGLRAMDQDHAAKNAAMQAAVHGVFTMMEGAPIPDADLNTKRSLAALAEVIAVGRTPVERDYRNPTTVLVDPSPESNTRLPQQLAQIAKGSARLEGRATVTDVDILIAHRVAFDTLLPVRAAALQAIATGRKMAGDVSRSTMWRALRDLHELGMIVDSGGKVDHILTDSFRRLWLAAKLDPTIPTPR
jgi:hypothetical protein